MADRVVAPFGLWKQHRDELPCFGTVCRMAREGRIPGTVSTRIGTPGVLEGRSEEALSAMRGAQ